MNSNFSNKVLFNEEAHFTFDGYVNKQNCRLWGSENPQVTEEMPLHPEKVFGSEVRLAEIPPNIICGKKWSKITTKESMLAALRVEII